MKAFSAFVLSLLVALSAVVVTAEKLDVTIQRAEIDDTRIEPFGENVLDIERDQSFELELELFSPVDEDDVEIHAFISGYEFSDIEPIKAQMGPFDVKANVTYKRSMTLELPRDLEEDKYKLRLFLTDRFGDEVTYNYELQINSKRHDVRIEDVNLNPGSSVTAGQALLVSVRLENFGQKDEKDVKVTATIPALGLSATDFINEVETSDEEETEEMFMRLPRCAKPGVYDMMVEAWYNNRRNKVSETVQVAVLENDACVEAEPVIVIQEETKTAEVAEPMQEQSVAGTSKVRSALEIILLVLVALLVVVGLIIGFTRMREE